jgi:aspartate aminotransferase
MPPSPIRKLVLIPYEAKKRGIKVYHLNIGQPDIETPQEAIKALQNTKIDVLAYSHSAGILSCRKKVSEYYKRWNINVTEDEIILTCGGSEAILFAFNSCLDPGDEVIIPEPFLWLNYNGFAVSSGVVVKPIVSVIDNGFALPPVADFEKLITPKTKAIMICNPNNPTGYLYSKEELQALAAIVKKYDLFLLADEVYREFAYDGAEIFSVMNLKEIEQNVILLDSVSKRYSACGARWECLLQKIKKFINSHEICSSSFKTSYLRTKFHRSSYDTPSSISIKYKKNILHVEMLLLSL